MCDAIFHLKLTKISSFTYNYYT